jgi:hypothetical protein
MGPRGYPQGRADFSSVSFLTLGAIAQLGERVNGIHEVGGSIPPGSTSFRKRDWVAVHGGVARRRPFCVGALASGRDTQGRACENRKAGVLFSCPTYLLPCE